MQDPRMPLSEEFSNRKSHKKKLLTPKVSAVHKQGNKVKGQERQGPLPLKARQKTSKRTLKNEVSPVFRQPETSNSDSFQEFSASGNDYRELRRKYLLLEEESFAVGRELGVVEDEVKTLEDEKNALLDQLVVLEGLIDPAELQSQGQHLQ